MFLSCVCALPHESFTEFPRLGPRVPRASNGTLRPCCCARCARCGPEIVQSVFGQRHSCRTRRPPQSAISGGTTARCSNPKQSIQWCASNGESNARPFETMADRNPKLQSEGEDAARAPRSSETKCPWNFARTHSGQGARRGSGQGARRGIALQPGSIAEDAWRPAALGRAACAATNSRNFEALPGLQ